MNVFRLRIDEIIEDAVVTSYTRWLESVQVIGTENPEVHVTFSPQFERIWVESKKNFPAFVAKEPANIGLRSQYSIRLYPWPKSSQWSVLSASPWRICENYLGWNRSKMQKEILSKKRLCRSGRTSAQRGLDVAIREINAKTDLRIKLESIERSKHRRVVALDFAIKIQAIPKRCPS
jgi:plasmid replication initiation protein